MPERDDPRHPFGAAFVAYDVKGYGKPQGKDPLGPRIVAGQCDHCGAAEITPEQPTCQRGVQQSGVRPAPVRGVA